MLKIENPEAFSFTHGYYLPGPHQRRALDDFGADDNVSSKNRPKVIKFRNKDTSADKPG